MTSKKQSHLSITKYWYYFILLAVVVLSTNNCTQNVGSSKFPNPSPENAGLLVPDGFKVKVVADSIGPARHIVVNDNGDIYVKLRRSDDEGSILALRDTTGDGKADIIKKFGPTGDEGNYETGINIYNGYLYFSSERIIFRYKMPDGNLVPQGKKDTVLIAEKEHHEHITKPISFDNKGNMYIPYGAGNNACQEPSRTPGVPGLDPCPNLKKEGGVWRFDANKLQQTQEDGERFATGIRSVVAQDWNQVNETLYIVMHGADNLHRLFPNKFTKWQNAVLPSEEMLQVTEGSNFGWPYCYYDQMQQKLVLAPQYGGDGKMIGRCSEFDDPVVGFPGHFAPNDLMFYRGSQFPEHYQNGAFVAFHGSTIRNPYPQAGYFIAFVPFENGKVSGDWEVFANGFAEVDPIVNTSDAVHRPGGLAMGPDGSLYITEDNEGKIWRIWYAGDKNEFGEEELAKMEKEKRTASNIRTPDKVKDVIQKEIAASGSGESLYNNYCASCHGRNGQGDGNRYPPLAGSEWVNGDKQRLIGVVLNGLTGNITVKNETYNNVMPQNSYMSNEEVAKVITYIRQNFDNNSSSVSPKEVQSVRENTN